jgi:hypothetical protein
MKSRDLSIPVNLVDSPSSMSLVVSVAFDYLKYSYPNTMSTAVANLTMASRHGLRALIVSDVSIIFYCFTPLSYYFYILFATIYMIFLD